MAFGHSRRLNDSNIVGAITFIKEEKTNIRKSNIELLRIIGMLMIIARHYMVNSGIMNAFEAGSTSMNYIFLT